MSMKKYHKKDGGKILLYHHTKGVFKTYYRLFCQHGNFRIDSTRIHQKGTKKALAAENIEYRNLGKTGLKVTPVGLGASRTNEPSVFNRAVNFGINFIDKERMYSEGRNEEIISKVIEGIRKNVIIQSKIDQKI